MMHRIPEPDLMDDWDQAVAYANADFEVPHNAFIERIKQKFTALPVNGHALDLGCGPGDITIRFATAFPSWTVDGVDGAPAMLKLGQDMIERRRLTRQISFYQVYLPQQSPPQASYDLIFSNSLLHHLTDPFDLWRSLLSLSTPDTPVFIMDLMRPPSSAIALEFKQKYAANEPEVLQKDFYHSLLAAYTLDEIRAQFNTAGLSHLQREAVSDRHWIAWGYPHRQTLT